MNKPSLVDTFVADIAATKAALATIPGAREAYDSAFTEALNRYRDRKADQRLETQGLD